MTTSTTGYIPQNGVYSNSKSKKQVRDGHTRKGANK